MARIVDAARSEAGKVLGAISDDEALLLAQTYQQNMAIRADHEFGRFDGDALLFVAAGDARESTAEEDHGGALAGERWRPHVSGEISEIRIPCTHAEMIKPDTLVQVWSGISGWLGLES